MIDNDQGTVLIHDHYVLASSVVCTAVNHKTKKSKKRTIVHLSPLLPSEQRKQIIEAHEIWKGEKP